MKKFFITKAETGPLAGMLFLDSESGGYNFSSGIVLRSLQDSLFTAYYPQLVPIFQRALKMMEAGEVGEVVPN